VKQNERGKPLVQCHAGCSQDAVIAALGERGLWDWPGMTPRTPGTPGTPAPRLRAQTVPQAAYQGSQAPHGRLVRHTLGDRDGRMVAVHCRMVDPVTGKKLGPVWWEQPDGTLGLGGRRVESLPLHGSETLRNLSDGAEVYVNEGEPARDALVWCGRYAVASVTGAATIPSDDVLRCLVRFRVVLWPDNDGPGQEHMSRIAARLVVVGCQSVEVIEPPADAPRGWDAADLLRPFADQQDHAAGCAAVDALPRERWALPAAEPQPTAGVDDFSLTHIGDLLAEPEDAVEWLVEDLLPMAGLGFLGAKPKVGKSTLSRNLALAVSRGGEFLGRRCAQGTVIYLALEEKRSQVKRHFRLMGATDSDPILVHVAKAPKDGLAALLRLMRDHQPVLVIIDPLLRFTRVRDEKAYAELSNALEGVMAAAREFNCCILATHHAPKATGTDAIDSLLGSTALSGAPDTVMVLRRQEQERTIETVQRYGSDLERAVLTLDPETGLLRLAGTVAEAHRQETHRRVLELLGSGVEMTTPEVTEAVDGRKADVLQALGDLAAAGQLSRSGTGRKGDPYRYHRPLDEIRYAVPDPTLGTAEPNPEMAQTPVRGNGAFRSGDSPREPNLGEEPGTESDSPELPEDDPDEQEWVVAG